MRDAIKIANEELVKDYLNSFPSILIPKRGLAFNETSFRFAVLIHQHKVNKYLSSKVVEAK